MITDIFIATTKDFMKCIDKNFIIVMCATSELCEYTNVSFASDQL